MVCAYLSNVLVNEVNINWCAYVPTNLLILLPLVSSCHDVSSSERQPVKPRHPPIVTISSLAVATEAPTVPTSSDRHNILRPTRHQLQPSRHQLRPSSLADAASPKNVFHERHDLGGEAASMSVLSWAVRRLPWTSWAGRYGVFQERHEGAVRRFPRTSWARWYSVFQGCHDGAVRRLPRTSWAGRYGGFLARHELGGTAASLNFMTGDVGVFQERHQLGGTAASKNVMTGAVRRLPRTSSAGRHGGFHERHDGGQNGVFQERHQLGSTVASINVMSWAVRCLPRTSLRGRTTSSKDVMS